METKPLVNLNTAEADELTQVPGVGPALAERIVEARPFDSFDDVQRVPGIGPSTPDKIAPDTTVEESLLVETESPSVEVSPVGLSFVDVTPLVDESEQRATEIPADLIPLPPLPIVPPWDEETASIIVEESAALEVVPPPLPETAAPSLAEVSPLLEETPPPLPEAITPIPPELPSPTEEAPVPAKVAAPPSQAQAPQAAERVSTSSKPVTRAQLAWVSFGIFVATLIITLALSLGILAGINGGLSFASPNDVAQVSREVAALRGQASTLEQSLNSVQTRLKNLEALGERVQTLETAKGELQRELETLSTQAKTLTTQVQDLNRQTEALSTQMNKVQTQAGQFQKVMDGLHDLLNTIFPNP